MARSKSILLKNLSGHIGKEIVIRTIRGKTFVSKYPDMSGVVPSEEQLKYKSKFSEAVAYAQSIINDPVKKAAYPVREGKSVYHSAIKDFMNKQEDAA
ncbi:hypothetical protein [Flavihumibacter petaseus]|uniref:Uncharacterized protein n=1 Tax=Flavihumibacter petaseus NBRC 106054 TaxID=1220578 RepID=A0A0E9N0X0_9BACT|nr:hypothetical protein [Flavihumibacter petaseus]GAO43657.1 hypothetical protein FPE01S_02_07630 [Flavihumibacter petaseus NBRC 106054]